MMCISLQNCGKWRRFISLRDIAAVTLARSAFIRLACEEDLMVGCRHVLLCVCLIVLLLTAPAPLQAGPDTRSPELQKSDAIALVRTTFVRLNDANLTADYAMLRATAAPDFQARFSERELKNLFSGMRAKRIDLTRLAALDPIIETARFHTGQHILQLIGYVDTSPIRTRFGFSFESFDGVWRLYGMTLDFEAKPHAPSGTPAT